MMPGSAAPTMPSADSRGLPQTTPAAAGGGRAPAPGRSAELHLPDSPAARGYMANPYQSTVEEAHNLLFQYLAPESLLQQNLRVENGVQYSTRERKAGDAPGRVPVYRGTAFIPNHRPIEILNCIHLFSYRLLWDTRLSSGRAIQRYSQYQLLFYTVFRGIGTMFHPRDAIGIQDVRCWGPNGVPQRTAFADTEQVDIVFKTIDPPELASQEGKVRMQIHLAAYRIEWREDLQGCNVTVVGDFDLNDLLPTFLWNVLSKELPMTVARLRSSITHFGIPPYILDAQDCVVIQIVSHYPQTRITTLKCHVRKPGTFAIVLDRKVMYSSGECDGGNRHQPRDAPADRAIALGIVWPPQIESQGSHAVQFYEWENQAQVTVGPEGVGKECTIVSVWKYKGLRFCGS